jgi:Holliday junction DNA helicase RuvA
MSSEPVTSDYAPVSNAMSDDIVSALVNLGYQKAAAEKAVANVFKENADASFETALKSALRTLAR